MKLIVFQNGKSPDSDGSDRIRDLCFCMKCFFIRIYTLEHFPMQIFIFLSDLLNVIAYYTYEIELTRATHQMKMAVVAPNNSFSP